MKFSLATVTALAAALVDAHYTFPSIVVDGVDNGDWFNVRKAANWQSNGPVFNVTSPAMTCYQLAPGSEGATTITVAAGEQISYTAFSAIVHAGHLSFWMAKAPAGETAATYDGSGAEWFKIAEDMPVSDGKGGVIWPSLNQSKLNVTIPTCVAPGDYLLRVEHIALHTASTVGGAQFYLSCAQITVLGGTSTATPTMVSIPGAYSATDPGILINIYYPAPTNYQPPGPKPLVC